ncbi:MAG: alpha/beta fold hydrolase [Planctomycetota bacterium]
MLHVDPWQIPGSDDQPILGYTHTPTAERATPPRPSRGTLILCHGFKGYMDYGFLPRLAQHISGQGFTTLRFNFSHSGVTRDFQTFARPDLFERDTWNRQIEDLLRVLAYARQHHPGPAALFGHSRGGLTALLAAARASPAPAAVITAAAPADASRLTPEQRRQLLDGGRLPSPSGRTGQRLYVGRDWQAQIDQDPEAHDPLRAAEKLACPLLLLHGDDDETVPVADLHRYQAAQPRAQTRILPGSNHVFNAPNPLTPDAPLPPATESLFNHLSAFLDEHLPPADP